MAEPTYLLDANVFIEAARRYYAFDIAPPFWTCLCEHAATGRILSIDRVKDELMRGKDDLSRWAENDFGVAFASTDEERMIQSFRDVMSWVQSQGQYIQAAQATFASGADGWLVAFARVAGHTVVTHEVPSPDVRRKVPIPNVCLGCGVLFTDTFNMLRELGIQFH